MTPTRQNESALASSDDPTQPPRVGLFGGAKAARTQVREVLDTLDAAPEIVELDDPAALDSDTAEGELARPLTMVAVFAADDVEVNSHWFASTIDKADGAPVLLIDSSTATFEERIDDLAWARAALDETARLGRLLGAALADGIRRQTLAEASRRLDLTQSGLATLLNQDDGANAGLDKFSIDDPSAAFAGLLGATSQAAASGTDIRDWIRRSDRSIFGDVLKRVRKHRAAMDVVVRINNSLSAEYSLRLSLVPSQSDGRKSGPDVRMIASSADNRFRPDLLSQGQRPTVDGRMALHTFLSAPLTQADQAGFGLICIAVDNLDALYDTLGVVGGDLSLQDVGFHLAEQLADTDRLFRVDTGVYVVFVERDSDEDIAETTQALQESVADAESGDDDREMPELTASASYAALSEGIDGDGHDGCLRGVLRASRTLSRLGGNNYGHHRVVAEIEAEEQQLAADPAAADTPPTASSPVEEVEPDHDELPPAADVAKTPADASSDHPSDSADDELQPAVEPDSDSEPEPEPEPEIEAEAEPDSHTPVEAVDEQDHAEPEVDPAPADNAVESPPREEPELRLVDEAEATPDSADDKSAEPDLAETADESDEVFDEPTAEAAQPENHDNASEIDAVAGPEQSGDAPSSDTEEAESSTDDDRSPETQRAANDDSGDFEHTPWTEPLQAALANDGFSLAYQGVTDLSGSDKPYFDVLLRYIDDSGNLVPAGEFLPDAERAGLMPHIDRWVASEALGVVAEQRAANKEIGLFVKLSPALIDVAEEFTNWLSELGASRGAQCDDIIFSVRETDIQEYGKRMESLLTALNKRGFKVALTHVSGAQQVGQILNRMPFAFVKLSAAFAQSIVQDDDDRLLQQVIEEMRKHKVPLIAEQIENADAMAKLWQAGINYVQGNFIQEPDTQTFRRDGTRGA